MRANKRFAKLLSWAVGAILCSAVLCSSATATVDIDNIVIGPAPHYAYVGGQSIPDPFWTNAIIYQTFTAGRSGVLTGVDIYGGVVGFSDVYFSLFAGGSHTAPGITLLAKIARPATEIIGNGIVSFDFSPFGIAVTAGETYTFSQSTDGCNGGFCTAFYNIFANGDGTTSAGYPGGSAMSLQEDILTLGGNDDLSFRTFVDSGTTAVPEPGTWAMMLAGLMLVGTAMRTRPVAPV